VFAADSGGIYALDQLGGFSVGQRVHIVGDLVSECGGQCADGLACVRNNSIWDASRYCDGGSVVTPDEPQSPDVPVVTNSPLTSFNLSGGACAGSGLTLISLTLVGLVMTRRPPAPASRRMR
jgi:hypothetical protein